PTPAPDRAVGAGDSMLLPAPAGYGGVRCVLPATPVHVSACGGVSRFGPGRLEARGNRRFSRRPPSCSGGHRSASLRLCPLFQGGEERQWLRKARQEERDRDSGDAIILVPEHSVLRDQNPAAILSQHLLVRGPY